MRQVDVSCSVEFGPRWLRGVATDPEIADVFADDAERFARMGTRKH